MVVGELRSDCSQLQASRSGRRYWVIEISEHSDFLVYNRSRQKGYRVTASSTFFIFSNEYVCLAHRIKSVLLSQFFRHLD